MTLHSIDPATGEPLADYPEMTSEEVSQAVAEAHRAFEKWRRASFAERTALLRRAGTVLRERSEELAELMAAEMGKPLAGGRAEVEKCAWVCDYYAENAAGFLADEPADVGATASYVAFRPLGVVLAVMPWNFPFWQVFRFAAPALAAGNAALLKHSSNVTGCALAIEELLAAAGCPQGLFRTLTIGSSAVAGVIAHPLVRAVTLTGSTEAGKAVAAEAGRRLKKTVLELGGSDPYVVLEDADLEAAAGSCAVAKLINSGQSCIAAKRFVVVEAVRERFESLLVERLRAAPVGDPREEGVEVGPMARIELRDELHDQVEGTVAAGATCLLGGEVAPGPGAFYPPTVLSGVGPGMPAYDEELFGPVAAIIPAADESEALRIANDSVFGLGAAVFTGDRQRGERIALEELEAGSCFVNDFVRSDPRLPFGGVKESGYGRELSSFGIREFVNIKTVYVA
jgi:succinate-semialdehyde dehydrogenase/glutarate-semialdehyde dehydrogenase